MGVIRGARGVACSGIFHAADWPGAEPECTSIGGNVQQTGHCDHLVVIERL